MDYIRVLSYSYYTTITGWGVLLTYNHTSNSGSKNDNSNGNEVSEFQGSRCMGVGSGVWRRI